MFLLFCLAQNLNKKLKIARNKVHFPALLPHDKTVIADRISSQLMLHAINQTNSKQNKTRLYFHFYNSNLFFLCDIFPLKRSLLLSVISDLYDNLWSLFFLYWLVWQLCWKSAVNQDVISMLISRQSQFHQFRLNLSLISFFVVVVAVLNSN